MTRDALGGLSDDRNGLGLRPAGVESGAARRAGAPTAPPGYPLWVVASAPAVVSLALADSRAGSAASLGPAAEVALLAMLATAVGFAAHRHLTGGTLSGWLSTGLTVPPVAVGSVASAAAVDARAYTPSGAAVLSLVCGTTLVLCVLVSGVASSAPRAPVTVGFIGGVVAAVASVAVSLLGSPDRPRPSGLGPDLVWVCVLALLAAPAAWTLLRSGLPPDVLVPLVLGTALVAAAAGAATWLPWSSRVEAACAILHLLAWCGFVVVAARLLALHHRLRDRSHHDTVGLAGASDDELRRAEGVLHEVRATVAGLASASRLLTEHVTLPGATRDRLDTMRHSEIERLERMLDDSPPVLAVDLWATLSAVVESVRAQGHVVGLPDVRALLHPAADEVACIVHVLLDNAARHGADPIELTVEDLPDAVLIAVTDAGPGVPEHLRARLFGWQESGAGSTGIGLYDARSRAHALGARLRLEERSAGRTRFELELPATHGRCA